MVIRAKENNVGAWAFLIGVILAILIGISTVLLPLSGITRFSSSIYAILVILGIIVGFTNVNVKDSERFMIAGAVLVIVSGFGMSSVSGSLIGFPIAEAVKTVFSALLTLFVPATIIVALKTVFEIAQV